MKRGVFHKYLLGFASFFLVPMFVLSICLHGVMYQNLVKEIISYNQNILERLGNDLITMNGRLMETGNRISFSSAVVSNDHSMEKQLEIVQTLRKFNADSSYFTKAYIIYKDQDMSYSSQGIYRKDVLADTQLRLAQEEQMAFFEWLYQIERPVYEVINKEYRSKENIIAKPQMLFIYPTYNYSNTAQSWIILELQSSKMKFSMETSPGIYSNSLTIMNKDGKILLTDAAAGDVSFSRAILQGAKEGVCSYVKHDLDNQNYVIYPLKNLNLVLINHLTIPGLLVNIVESNSPLVLGVLVFLVLGCILAIYMAYRYYKPIRQLAQYMKQGSEPEAGKNEFTFIKEQYDSLNSVKESLMKEIESQWPLVEERLVTKLLYDGAGTKASDIMGKVLEEQMNNQQHLVVLITGDRPADKEHRIRNMFEKEYMVYTSYIYYYEAVAVVFSRDHINDGDVQRIRGKLLQELQNDAGHFYTGAVHEDASGVHLSYLEALTSMGYQLHNPHKMPEWNIQNGESSQEYGSKISRYQTESLLLIRRCIESDDLQVIEESIDEIILNLEELPGQMAVMCCYDILNHLVKEIKKRNVRIQDSELYGLTVFRTVEEFCGKLKTVLQQINKAVAASRQETRNDLAKQIMEYIEANYRDSNLCLMGLADHFGYSSTYLSKFITQNLNTSFSDLVSGKRLEYTKNCLIHTDKQIAQIAQEAGYVNLSNFTRRFKKYENMTPGQYRALHGKVD